MSNRRKSQLLIREYREATGVTEIDMRKVAQYAADRGWPLPKPRSAIDLLAKQFTDAARQENKYDQETGKPYRVNHAVPVASGSQYPLWVWVDIDDAKRPVIRKSLVHRREQMVDDGYQLTLDLEHWNRINPDQEPIELPMDLIPDIEWRKNTPDANAA